MGKRLAATLVILFVVALLPALHADAATAPSCGASVHGTVVFTGDLTCNGQSGLTLDGNAVIKLNGKTFTGDSRTAIDNSAGHRLILVGPGKITGWFQAVESDGGRARVAGLTFDNIDSGFSVIVINANNAQVDGNVFTHDNASNDADYLLTIDGQKAKVLNNDMTDLTTKALTADIGMFDANKSLVRGNRVVAPDLGAEGIIVEGNRTSIIHNHVSGAGGNGIRVDGRHVRLKANATTSNKNDGIFIEPHSTVALRHNVITGNGNFGIEATTPPTPKTKHDTFSNNANGNCSWGAPCH